MLPALAQAQLQRRAVMPAIQCSSAPLPWAYCRRLSAPVAALVWLQRKVSHVLPSSLHPQRPAAPHVGVGVLVVQNKLVLLGRRKGSHGAGTWSAPGGKLEFGEELEHCADRELLEETGLVASSLELGPYSNDVFVEEGKHFLTVFLVARGITGTPQNLEPDKCEGWAWFSWDALPQPLFKPLQTLVSIGWKPAGA